MYYSDMTDHGTITIAGQVPSKSNSYRIVTVAGHGSLAKTDALKKYETAFYLQMGKYRDLGIKGLFEFYADVYYTSMSHDIDNAMKILLDCLQKGGAIKNDNRCTHIVARKFIDKKNPRVELKIIEL